MLVIILLALLIILVYGERHNLWNLGVYNVVSSSMSPSIKKGSILITRPSSTYVVGDVITFLDPRNSAVKITHRIEKIESDETGLKYITKGDSNDNVDPWNIREEMVVGSVVLNIPFIGLFIPILKSPFGSLLFVILPLGAIFFMEAELLLSNISESILKGKNKTKNELPYGV